MRRIHSYNSLEAGLRFCDLRLSFCLYMFWILQNGVRSYVKDQKDVCIALHLEDGV